MPDSKFKMNGLGIYGWKPRTVPARDVVLLAVALAVLAAPHLNAQINTYPVLADPSGFTFDGTNVWVTCSGIDIVIKLNAAKGKGVEYGAGPEPTGIAFDGTNIWVANQGSNNVTKLLASTGAPIATYPVGSRPTGIAFDGTNIWVTNENSNTVTKLLASTGATVGTYTVGLYPFGIAFDGTNIWVASQGSGLTKLLASTGATIGTYPIGGLPYGVAFDGTDIWVTDQTQTVTKLLASTGAQVATYKLSASTSLLSTAIAFDGTNIWVAESSTNEGDGVVEIPAGSPPTIVSAASFNPGAVVPGSLFSIFGAGLSPGIAAADALPLPTELNGTSVSVNGISAPLLYVSPTQINGQLPLEIQPGPAQLVVSATGLNNATGDFTVAAAWPGIFTYGLSRAIAVNPDGSLNGPAAPAHPGDILVVYLTGGGPVNPSGGTWMTGAASPPGLSPCTLPFTVTIGGLPAFVDYLGLTSTTVGLYQLNVHVPVLPAGDQTLFVTIGGNVSNSALISVAP